MIFMSTLSLILSRRQRTCCLDVSDDRSDEYGCKKWSFQIQSDTPSFHVITMHHYSLPHCIVCPCRAVIVPLFACLSELGNGHQAAFARMFSLTHALLLGRILSHIPFFFLVQKPSLIAHGGLNTLQSMCGYACMYVCKIFETVSLNSFGACPETISF